ncbi:hypothetical protein J6590_011295 [Homalodisca vitripennis]|nr:hypothetical protein J6590_011295 [Homalodisca vitripennis]
MTKPKGVQKKEMHGEPSFQDNSFRSSASKSKLDGSVSDCTQYISDQTDIRVARSLLNTALYKRLGRRAVVAEAELSVYKVAYTSVVKESVEYYEGSSGGTETVAAVSIFGRSEEKRGVKFEYFLDGGDSKAYQALAI